MHIFSTNIDQCLASAVVCFTYVSVSASTCRKARFASSTRSCRLFPVLVRVAALLITYLYYERKRWSSYEVAGGPFLFDLPCSQSTSYFHSFTVTFVAVSPSTRDRFACCSHPAHLVSPSQAFTYTQHSSSSSHRSNPHTLSSSPPGSNGRLPLCIGCISTSLSVTLLQAPPVVTESCGPASS